MRGCESIVALTKKLGVSRRQLYRWRDEVDPGEPEVGKPPGPSSTTRREVRECALEVWSPQSSGATVKFLVLVLGQLLCGPEAAPIRSYWQFASEQHPVYTTRTRQRRSMQLFLQSVSSFTFSFLGSLHVSGAVASHRSGTTSEVS